jgi:hypothetical protein
MIHFDDKAFRISVVNAGYRSVAECLRAAGVPLQRWYEAHQRGRAPSPAHRVAVATVLNTSPDAFWKPAP